MMCGEYGMACDGKMPAQICNDELFIMPKKIPARLLLEKWRQPSQYAGVKPYFLISGKMDEQDWLSKLVAVTARERPMPIKEKKRKRNPSQLDRLEQKFYDRVWNLDQKNSGSRREKW